MCCHLGYITFTDRNVSYRSAILDISNTTAMLGTVKDSSLGREDTVFEQVMIVGGAAFSPCLQIYSARVSLFRYL